jgi:hypothetical protein
MMSGNGHSAENKPCAGFKLFCAYDLKSAVSYNDFEVQKMRTRASAGAQLYQIVNFN